MTAPRPAAVRCPDCGRGVQKVGNGPAPFCLSCDPQPGVAKLRDQREKDRDVAAVHAAWVPHSPARKGGRR